MGTGGGRSYFVVRILEPVIRCVSCFSIPALLRDFGWNGNILPSFGLICRPPRAILVWTRRSFSDRHHVADPFWCRVR